MSISLVLICFLVGLLFAAVGIGGVLPVLTAVGLSQAIQLPTASFVSIATG